MTQTRRLVLNAIATFGRSFYQLACGLLTGRWMLLALGASDYGLLGLVGGLVMFMTIFNSIFSSAVSRYYAYSVGAAEKSGNSGLMDCRAWFSAALMIHCLLPTVIFCIGYPLGEFAIRSWLTIAPDRMNACLWVFRFSCISCFVGIICVPFRAMYVAKQEIAELTIYSFVITTLHVLVLYYMVTHSQEWLAPMAFWMMLQVVIPAVIIAVRAVCVFPECRVIPHCLFDFKRASQLFSFAGWQFLGNVGVLIRDQSNAIFVNRFLGPVYNAANTVSCTVAGHAQMFANEVNSVFFPAITNACGAGNKKLMSRLVHQCSKYSTLVVLYLTVPLMLEMHSIITLWLKTPPPATSELCVCACVVCIINKVTCGQWMAVDADGRIIALQVVLFFCYISAPIIAGAAFMLGGGIIWIGYSAVISMTLIAVSRIVLARTRGAISIYDWLTSVLLPVSTVCFCGVIGGLVLKLFIKSSVIRTVSVCCLSEVALLAATWLFALSKDEKKTVLCKLARCVDRVCRVSKGSLA